ncbi:MAG: methylenetetrahydrofolate reductase [Lentisphaerae bacterium]|jgi:methylenetetrahydrofolate reductase (NADPH)|nr:methylenetetrahydrofolate reductase [Lentisphaerota bacterium]MBT4818795.1 methylenetetrahydrofolate reductase [Lentisphaerota bacterium]MBT5606293.1 methylenetetrahydrofolate reductase [Lentisphaerota bacterium]MBT7848262.1 methylenetetrahydrofolate reductase [Lentisphaerota bacterium]
MSEAVLKSGSNLERVFAAGHFAVTSELGPPKSADLAIIDKKADYLRGQVDAVNLTDNQTAIVRISSIAAARLLLDRGIEPVIQMTCRDRNRLAQQADILGAYVLGVRNIVCLSGDHQCFGNHPTAKHVFDIDSVQLIKAVKDMRDDGVFMNGDEIRNTKKSDVIAPKMFIGGAANPFGDPFEFRVIRLAKKVAAGVDFIQTQCIYDMDRFERWMVAVRERGLHKKVQIMAGLTPLKSSRMTQYMASNVAGISVPDYYLERMAAAEDGAAEGIQICVEQIKRLRQIEGVSGIHLMAIEWESRVPEILERAGLLPRPVIEVDEEQAPVDNETV